MKYPARFTFASVAFSLAACGTRVDSDSTGTSRDSGGSVAEAAVAETAPGDRDASRTNAGEAGTAAGHEAGAPAGHEAGASASETDAAAGVDASGASGAEAGVDSGPGAVSVGGLDAGSDSGPSPDELAWLTPMNAARAMVGEMPLRWDPIAAQVALTYADQCNYAHNPNAGAQYKALGGVSGLGENIAAGAPSQTVSSAVGSWLSEQASYDHATNQCAAGKDCGHYTQIVWSTTTGVGCAAASCTTNSPFGTFANGLWDFEVCDFAPPGNVNGEPPY
jgi:pathogenesis-related protein 1